MHGMLAMIRSLFVRNLSYVAPFVLLVVLAPTLLLAGGDQDKGTVSSANPHAEIGSAIAANSERPGEVRTLRMREQRAAARVKRLLRSTSSRKERKRSLTAYKDQDAKRARASVIAHQPSAIKATAWSAPSLKRGESITDYTDEHTAVIDMPGTETLAFVRSTVEPIATAVGDGKFAPIDLTLRQESGAYVAKNSRAKVSLPAKLADGVAFGEPGGAAVTLRLGGRAARGTLSGSDKKLFYANTDTDTDTILEATPEGAAVSWTIRSPEGPSRIPLEFSGQVGGFKALGDGGVEFDAGALGRGEITAPIAYDAQGTSVPVRIELVDGRPVVTIEHKNLDLAYPLVVDPWISFDGIPAFVDDAGLSSNGTPKSLTNDGVETPFAFSTSNTTNFLYSSTAENSGYRMKVAIRSGAGTSGWANLLYNAPSGSTIFRAHFTMTNHVNNYYTTIRAGIVNAAGAWESQKNGRYGGSCADPNGCWSTGSFLSNTTGLSQSEIHSCASATCGMGGSGDNRALLQFSFDKPAGAASNTSGSYISSRGAYIYYSDYSAPILTAGGFDVKWKKRLGNSLNLSADDQGGVGLGRSTYLDASGRQMIAKSALNMFVDGVAQLPQSPGVGYEGTGVGPYCTGRFNNPCPQTHSVTVTNYSDAFEGIRTFRFEAADIVGRTSTQINVLKTDNAGPEVDISGRLGAFALEDTATGAVDVRTVVKSTPFVIQAIDGQQSIPGSAAPNSERRSGVKSISAKLYPSNANGSINETTPAINFDQENGGNPKQSAAAECDQNNYPNAKDSCQLRYEGTFDAPALPPGIYYFKVTAKDWIDNTTNKIFKVAVGVASVESVTEGQSTARYVPLKIKRSAGQPATSTALQFRSSLGAKWCDISSSALRAEDDVNAGVTPPVAFNGSGVTSVIVVDLDALRKPTSTTSCTSTSNRLADGTVYLRALLPGSSIEAARASEDVAINYSRGGLGTSDDTANIGPGSVDLVTGNLSISQTDVSVDAYKSSLTLTRTYNSRYVNDPGHVGIFGPGWKAGFPSDGSGAAYTKVTDFASVELPETERFAAVELETINGEVIAFELGSDSKSYIPEPGFESLELTRIEDAIDSTRTAGFTLYDKDSGAVTTFKTRPDGAPREEYLVTDSYTTDDAESITFAWGVDSVVGSYPTYVFAPEAGLTCRSIGQSAEDAYANLPVGCQALRFVYDVPSNQSNRRLISVNLKTYDPEKSPSPGMDEFELAKYAYDSSKRLIEARDPRLPAAMKTTYSYPGSPPGSRHILTMKSGGTNPYTFTYNSLPEDSSAGRLSQVSQVDGSNTAVTNIRYAVPTAGGSAPFDFSQAEVSKWGQQRPPFMAAAVFDASNPPNGNPASNYGVATMSYMDPLGREVNTRAPGGRISTVEYDADGDVTRTLSPENRARALGLSTPAARLTAAKKWDTKNFYAQVPDSINGRTHLTRTIGPEHEVRLDGGSLVQARAQTSYCYDEATEPADFSSRTYDGSCSSTKLPNDAESGEPFDLVTSTRTSALVGADEDGAGGSTSDGRAAASYYGTSQAELKLGLAQVTAEDAGNGNLNIKRKTDFNVDGQETARYQPRSQSSGEPSTTKTYYYVAGTSADDPDCSGKSEWRGLVCKVVPGAQPTASGLPKLPVKKITYNRYRQPLGSTESVVDAAGGTKTRTRTLTYDGAGRPLTEEITADIGEPVKKTQHVYNDNGQEVETRSLNSNGTTYKSVYRSYDSLGRQIGYVDAEGNISTTSYDILSRPLVEGDPKSTRTNSYDGVTGDLSALTDSGLSGAGNFAAVRDAEGRITSEAMPGGLAKSTVYDTAGNVTSLTYTRTADCSTGCNWLVNTAEYNIHGQMVAQDGLPTQSGGSTSQKFGYDGVGRLSEVKDTVSGQCETRRYEFDADSNRTATKTYTPGSGGACSTSGSPTTKSNSFDSADRITNAGYEYDAFGRTTKVPQVDAGGTGDMNATYYANDLARSITQNGKTQTLDLDPMLRARTKTKSGGWSGTETYAYSDDSDSPAWIADGSGWTRYVPGIDGSVAATQKSNGALAWTVSNIRGDMIAEAGGGGLTNVREVDEFGSVKGGLPSSRPYGFHGSKVRMALTDGGTIAMGVRLYVPGSGRFMQTDPIIGGTANPYEYPSDPINDSDLRGTFKVKRRVVERPTAKKILKWLRKLNSVQKAHNGLVAGGTCTSVAAAVGVPTGGVAGAFVGAMCSVIGTVAGDKLPTMLKDQISGLRKALITSGKHGTGRVIVRAGITYNGGLHIVKASQWKFWAHWYPEYSRPSGGGGGGGW